MLVTKVVLCHCRMWKTILQIMKKSTANIATKYWKTYQPVHSIIATSGVWELTGATMSRPTIPPLSSPPPHAQSQEKTEVLRRRLATAEEDARKILSQLGSVGQTKQSASSLHTDYGQRAFDKEKTVTFEKGVAEKPPLPSDGSMVEPMPSSFSQDALISRVCKLESMLQTLKLGLAGATSGFGGGSVDKKRLKAEVEERVGQVKHELGSEVARLKRQMASLQEELNMEMEARRRLKEESEKLKEALEDATQARVKCSLFILLACKGYPIMYTSLILQTFHCRIQLLNVWYLCPSSLSRLGTVLHSLLSCAL